MAAKKSPLTPCSSAPPPILTSCSAHFWQPVNSSMERGVWTKFIMMMALIVMIIVFAVIVIDVNNVFITHGSHKCSLDEVNVFRLGLKKQGKEIYQHLFVKQHNSHLCQLHRPCPHLHNHLLRPSLCCTFHILGSHQFPQE